jgi:2-hydroxy-3-oxopropionate reductase
VTTRIAVLGTGLMGAPMAARLTGAGFAVTAWNRTGSKAAALGEYGIAAAPSAAAAVADADIVLTMLADGPTVVAVLLGPAHDAAAHVPTGALLVDMSSIPPATARDHAGRLKAGGVGYVDAPVSGGVVGAEAGTLAIMAGGTAEDFDRAAEVFAALGRAVHVGPAGTGQVAKLCNLLIVGVTFGAVAEALLLAEASGADPAAVRAALTGGFADSRILALHGQRMIERAFTPGGKVATQTKDLDTVVAAAAEAGLTLPIAGLADDLFRAAMANGDGALDHAALYLELARRNGRS